MLGGHAAHNGGRAGRGGGRKNLHELRRDLAATLAAEQEPLEGSHRKKPKAWTVAERLLVKRERRGSGLAGRLGGVEKNLFG